MSNITEKDVKENTKHIYIDFTYAGMLLFLLFRIPLTNIIGNEGNGYLAYTLEIYSLFSLFFGYAFYRVGVKMLKIQNRKQRYQIGITVFTLMIIFAFVLSVIGGCILYFSSNFLFQNMILKLMRISFKYVGVLLIVTAINGVFRGYFEGMGTQIPTFFSKIIEAFVFGTSAIIFCSVLDKYGAKVGALLFDNKYKSAFSASGVICGCIVGSVFSFLFLIVVKYLYQRAQKGIAKPDVNFNNINSKSLRKDFIKVTFFVILELICFKAFRIANISIFMNQYLNTLEGENKLLSIVGAYHGKVLVVISVAALFILSFTGENISNIRKFHMRRVSVKCWNYLCLDLQKIVMFSIPFSLIIGLFSKNILSFLYKSAGLTEITFMRIESINVIFIVFAIYFYKILYKLNYNISVVVIPFIAFIIQSILMLFLVKIPKLQNTSFVIAEVVFWFVVALLELFIVIKELKPTKIKDDI